MFTSLLRKAALTFAALAFALPLGFADMAAAQPASTAAERDARIRALEEQLAVLEAQLNDLKESVAAESADVDQIQQAQTEGPTVTLNNARPRVATADGQFTAQLRGMIQFDVAAFDQDDPQTPDNRRSDSVNPGDLSAGSNFRRVRFGIEGTAFRDWNYGLIAEYGGTGAESAQLNQAYLEYAGWEPWDGVSTRVRAGAWATPTGLEDATSNTESLFLERPAPAELVRNIAGGDGRNGIGVFAHSARWYGSAVYTGATVGNANEYDEQRGYLLRAAFQPLQGETYGVHLGASMQGVIEPPDTDPSVATVQNVRLRERPELRVDAQRFVDTAAIPTERLTAYGLEAGGAFGPFYAAGEWFQINLDRTDGAPDPDFGGWYVQGAWALTGEHRAWNAASGGFPGLRPAHRFDPNADTWGALEIAARYSVLDLNHREGAINTAPIAGTVRGGEQTIRTLGLNWYPNNTVRFLIDYQWVEIDRLDPENSAITPTGGPPAVPGVGAQIGQDFQAISVRTQVAF